MVDLSGHAIGSRQARACWVRQPHKRNHQGGGRARPSQVAPRTRGGRHGRPARLHQLCPPAREGLLCTHVCVTAGARRSPSLVACVHRPWVARPNPNAAMRWGWQTPEKVPLQNAKVVGTSCRDRTDDHKIKSLALYRTELRRPACPGYGKPRTRVHKPHLTPAAECSHPPAGRAGRWATKEPSVLHQCAWQSVLGVGNHPVSAIP